MYPTLMHMYGHEKTNVDDAPKIGEQKKQTDG
jgi:hypothetical protein